MPAGVFNILTADREVSELLVRDPRVDKITFTGSSAAGRKIASEAVETYHVRTTGIDQLVSDLSGGNRQKFEIYGSNGYLGQNSPYLTVGLGDAKEADFVRMLWRFHSVFNPARCR